MAKGPRNPPTGRAALEKLVLTAEAEEAYCRLIRERSGIVVRDGQLVILRNAVVDACQRFKLKSSDDYLDLLGDRTATCPEMEFLISAMTVGESYFFRDAIQVEFLRTHCLPDLISRKRADGSRMIRVWSAGCSMGQELYTIAILLEELLPDIDQWTVHLLGSDINAEHLRIAIDGRYSDWSLRSATEQQKDRYFKREGKQSCQLLPRICRRARFIYQNLAEDNFPTILSETHAQDLVVCRNVLIYMEHDGILAISRKLAASLVPGGVLLLGAADPHSEAHSIPELHSRHTEQTQYFVHEPVVRLEKPTAIEIKPQASPTRVREAVPVPVLRPKRVAAKVKPRRSPVPPISVAAPVEIKYPEIKGLLSSERWSDALRAIEALDEGSRGTPFVLQLEAKTLANLGRLEEAVELCELAFEKGSTDKHTHFIYALALSGMGRFSEAEAALRKALFLDHQFVEAHYQLALLLFGSGRMPLGLKSLQNALKIAKAGDPDRGIHDSPGMTYGRFVEVLQSEFDIYSQLGSR